MHPAKSLILFTSLSGLGFGLFTYIGLMGGGLTGWPAFFQYALAYGLSSAGLLSSLFHLGNPQRAWRALSQWRSSWLSREGVLAVATLAIFAPQAVSQIWGPGDLVLLGELGALLSLATIGSTAMIYAQLKTVPRWHHPAVPVLFYLYALSGGAILFGQAIAAALFLALLGLAQGGYWIIGDQRFANSGSSMHSATGLGQTGSLRLLERPHTGASYLTQEMMFQVARRRVVALRRLFWAFGIALPLLLALLHMGWGLGWASASTALACHFVGLIASRWLFYAQAEHVVSLYYGNEVTA